MLELLPHTTPRQESTTTTFIVLDFIFEPCGYRLASHLPSCNQLVLEMTF